MFQVLLLWGTRSNLQIDGIAALAGLKTICLKGAWCLCIEYLGTVGVLEGLSFTEYGFIRYSRLRGALNSMPLVVSTSDRTHMCSAYKVWLRVFRFQIAVV